LGGRASKEELGRGATLGVGFRPADWPPSLHAYGPEKEARRRVDPPPGLMGCSGRRRAHGMRWLGSQDVRYAREARAGPRLSRPVLVLLPYN
jgi:hypothetical protein